MQFKEEQTRGLKQIKEEVKAVQAVQKKVGDEVKAVQKDAFKEEQLEMEEILVRVETWTKIWSVSVGTSVVVAVVGILVAYFNEK
jgi:hypothetical protein